MVDKPDTEKKADANKRANPPPEEDLEALFRGDAVYSNKVYATLNPLGMRLTFSETHAELSSPQYRTAVFLQLPDALSLRDLLNRVLENVVIQPFEPSDGDAE